MPKDLCDRTFAFATRIVCLCRELDKSPGVSRTLCRQLLRSGTSIGANVEEAQSGQSRADFVSKMQIAGKPERGGGHFGSGAPPGPDRPPGGDSHRLGGRAAWSGRWDCRGTVAGTSVEDSAAHCHRQFRDHHHRHQRPRCRDQEPRVSDPSRVGPFTIVAIGRLAHPYRHGGQLPGQSPHPYAPAARRPRGFRSPDAHRRRAYDHPRALVATLRSREKVA
ncbi:MAG: four helix bundle protein [Planctomycetes bacterium]|nr:four helix bundle protein [Planctomycetota bacterium]